MESSLHPAIDGEKRYKRLINFLTDYIYTVNVYKGEVVNTVHGPGVVSVTGYTSNDYLHDPGLWFRMIHDEDRDFVIEKAKQALKGEYTEPFHHRIIHRDGSVRWVSNSIVLSKDENGYLHYYDGLIKDITHLKKAEEETRVKEQQLIQADKMVSLGILVSGVAHEISNPNNFILLNIKLFSKAWEDVQPILNKYYEENGDFVIAGMPFSKSGGKINNAMEGIHDGSKRIKEIVSNLTNYARQDSGNLNGEVDIVKGLKNAVLIVNNLIKKSTNNFKTDTPANTPLIKGNQQQIEQVLINLISNACHSLQNKAQKILIGVNVDKEQREIKIIVKDEGRGISDENLKRVFEPFFTTKRDYGGSGLGLSITYNIIKNHGGDLVLESKIDEGTRAIITLPFFEEGRKTSE
jgi:PAS domain S-box-containing protein